jgi:hypothetical protein
MTLRASWFSEAQAQLLGFDRKAAVRRPFFIPRIAAIVQQESDLGASACLSFKRMDHPHLTGRGAIEGEPRHLEVEAAMASPQG